MKKLKLVVGTSLVGLSGSTFAVVDPAISTAFTEAGADAATVIGYIALASIVFVASLWVLKGIRKGG